MQRALERCLFRLPKSTVRLWNSDRHRRTGIADGFWRSSEGISCYSTDSIAKPKRMPMQHREIMTLDATKMQVSGQRTYDISGYRGARFTAALLKPPQHIDAQYMVDNHRSVPFPPGSIGVFYYRPPSPGAPVLSGELRFKLCRDVAFFTTSPDLQLPNEMGPWSLNLYSMIATPKWKALRRMLVHESFVSPVTVEAISSLPRVNRRNSRNLYSLEQPFELDLSQKNVAFVFLTLKLAFKFRFFTLYAGTGMRGPIYTGRVKAHFELSTLPEHSSKGPTLVLRVLELLTPLECNVPGKMLEPRPGELLSRHERGKNYAWSFPLEKRTLAPALREFIGLPPLPEDKIKGKIPPKSPHYLLTLSPDEIKSKEQVIIDISGQLTVSLRPRLQDGRKDLVRIGYGNITGGFKPFPPNTRGVLYYCQPSSGEPVMSGALRFRVCEDAATFQDGSDLLAPNGMEPWNMPLYHLVKSPGKKLLVDLMLQEGLVKQDAVAKIAKFPTIVKGYPPLYAPDWPFVVNLTAFPVHLGLVNLSMFEFFDIRNLFRLSHGSEALYAGYVKARFEFSTQPEHAGSQVLVLRILELLEPVQRLISDAEDMMPVPRAGSLWCKKDRSGKLKPWTYDLDQRAGGEVFKRFIATCEKQ